MSHELIDSQALAEQIYARVFTAKPIDVPQRTIAPLAIKNIAKRPFWRGHTWDKFVVQEPPTVHPFTEVAAAATTSGAAEIMVLDSRSHRQLYGQIERVSALLPLLAELLSSEENEQAIEWGAYDKGTADDALRPVIRFREDCRLVLRGETTVHLSFDFAEERMLISSNTRSGIFNASPSLTDALKDLITHHFIPSLPPE